MRNKNKEQFLDEDEVMNSFPSPIGMTINNFDDLDLMSSEEIIEQKKKSYKDFINLVNSVSAKEEKIKTLWVQVYEHAMSDRTIAYIAWRDLYSKVCGNPTEHAIHGQNLSRYMERMSKANDQLLKLSEQISLAEKKESDTTVADDDIYKQLENLNK